jgi:hypothetical protein
MENEKSKEKKLKKMKKKEKDINVFNTSVINSILNRTNKEEMEMLFDINFENINNEENIFLEKIDKLIDNINTYEVKEDYYIDYNYESKNDKKNGKKEIISPLMNININYINFNKFNDVKTNSVSFNNQNNKNNSLLCKIFNVPEQNSKQNIKNQINNKLSSKEANSFLMKLNHIKQDKKVFQNVTNYLRNLNNNKISINKNTASSLGKNNSNLKLKLGLKNQTIVYDYKDKEKNKKNEVIDILKNEKGNQSLKNIFSYRTSFGYLSPNNNNNNNNNIELPNNFPLSSRNKNNDLDKQNINIYLTNHKYFNKNPYQSPNNNKSTLARNENNLYALMNNSRNKILLNNPPQLIPSSSSKYINMQNSITPLSSKFKIKQRKKLKHNYSVLNNKIFDKRKLWNLENNNFNTNRTILKEKENFLFNNLVNDESNVKKNTNINKNSIFDNKTNSIKQTKLYQNNSSRNINSKQRTKRINNKKDITGI